MNNGDERRAIDGLTTSDDGRTGRTRRFGFGGYSGGVSLRDASASGEVSSEVLDEDAAPLRRCAQKSSTSTKVKALRELEESLFDGDEDDGARGGGGARKSVDALAALVDRGRGRRQVGGRRRRRVSSRGVCAEWTHRCGVWERVGEDTKVDAARVGVGEGDVRSRGGGGGGGDGAFERTFSTDERRRGAMAHAHEVIFDDLVESLGRRGPGDMIFRDGSESEQFARFDLSVRAALSALAFTCERLCAHASAESDAAAEKFNAAMNSLSQLKVPIKGEFASIRREASRRSSRRQSLPRG